MKRSVQKLVMASLAIFALTMAVLPQGALPVAGAAGDGAALYKARCAMCHAIDGSGDTTVGKSMKVPDLRSPKIQTQSDAQLYDVIVKGKGKMPAYERTIGADNCKELVAYIRQLGRK